MRKIIIKGVTLAMLLGAVCLSVSCKDDEGHNAGAAVVVNRFYPTSGSAGTEILITGKNFTTDASQVSVMLGNTALKVLGCDMNNILVVVPSKLGEGPLSISIHGREPVTTVDNFSYSFSAKVSTFAGNGEAGYFDGKGTEAMFHFLREEEQWTRGSICVDGDGNLLVGDDGNYCIRKITPDGTVTTLAGYAGAKGDQDGNGLQARFCSFYGMDIDAAGNLYVADVFCWKIRKVTPEGEVTTLGSCNNEVWEVAVDPRNGNIYYCKKDLGIFKFNPDGNDEKISGSATSDIVFDADGNLYAADQVVQGIVKYEADTWQPTTLVGNGTPAYVDGSFEEARFAYPSGIALGPDGNIYVAGNGSWDGGENADQSIRMLDMQNRVVRTVAGGALRGYADANGTSAMFDGPVDVAVDKNGIIYVYDKRNNVVRKIVYE